MDNRIRWRDALFYVDLLQAGIAALSTAPLHVIYEDNHLLAVVKPAGLPTIGVADDQSSLAKLAKQYLKTKYQKPGNVFLGVMSRLDAVATGIVVFARTSKAAARLTDQFRNHTVDKVYLAVLEGTIEPSAATLEDWVAKNESRHRMETVPSTQLGAQQAQLAYRRLETGRKTSLVEVKLETGRKHQIRLQMASRGHPIVGDTKYGSNQTFPRGIALHSTQLTIQHPTCGDAITFTCPPPPTWRSFGFMPTSGGSREIP